MISHQYIGKGESKIYLCSYIIDEKNPNVLIVPPLGWYSIGPNRIFSRLSGLLNDIGVNVFTFDYLGQGESLKSCKEITINDLEYSFNMVLEYVKKIGSDIYCLGYGIGNHFLANMQNDSIIKGIIFYAPDYYDSCSYLDVFEDKEIEEACENGYFTVTRDRTRRCKFWKSLVGGFQDVFYNPINYSVVSGFKGIPVYTRLTVLQSPVFIVSDKEFQYDRDNVTVLYVNHLENNILPSDWEENVWPFVLDNINESIVQWIDKQIKNNHMDSMSSQETNTKCTLKAFSYMDCKNKSRRVLFRYSSIGQENLGVMHLPVNLYSKPPCIIFVTGLGGDKIESHMCGPRLGEYFAERGFALVRYDSRFSGTSTRCLSQCTISGLKEDFDSLVQYLNNFSELINTDEIIIIGWSEGAKIALLDSKKLKGSCFWNAVLTENEIEGSKTTDFQSSLRSFVRHRVTKKKVKSIHNAGELVGLDYILDNRKVNYLELLQHTRHPIKLVWSKSEIANNNYQSLKKYNLSETIIDSDHHLFNYEIMDYIFDITFRWIQEILEYRSITQE